MGSCYKKRDLLYRNVFMSSQQDRPWVSLIGKYAPWLVGVAAFLLYAFTQSRDLIPGIPTRVLNSVCGLDPLPVTAHRLYSLAAQAFTRVMPGSEFANLNLFSALFAALSIVILYRLMLYLPISCSRTIPRAEEKEQTARHVGAVAWGLLLLISVPFWQAATRAGSLTFDLFLLLSCFMLAARYAREGTSKAHILAASLLYGLGITEYATLILTAPLFALLAVVVLLRRGQLNASLIAQMIGFGFLGLLFYLASPLALAGTPDFGYGQYGGPMEVLIDVWRKQYHEIRAGTPQVGVLLIVLSCFGPWIYVFFMTRPRHGNLLVTEFAIGLSLLLLLMLGATLLLESRVSPYQLVGRSPIILPYISVASWMGMLVAYWYIFACTAVSSTVRSPRFIPPFHQVPGNDRRHRRHGPATRYCGREFPSFPSFRTEPIDPLCAEYYRLLQQPSSFTLRLAQRGRVDPAYLLEERGTP